jgi:hypothetical protein
MSDQETRVEPGVEIITEEPVSQDVADANPPAAETQAPNKSGGVRQAAAAAVGAAGGAGVAYAVENAFRSGADAGPTADALSGTDEAAPEANAASFDDSKVPVAAGVNDGMSFPEAFAAGRGEVGSGGVFWWRGACYNTYTREEWSQLSPEDRTAFSSHRYDPPDNGPAARSTGTDVAEHHPEQTQEVEVLGPARPVEIQVIAAPGRINGQDAILVDVDSNGTIDVAVTSDGRGELHAEDISGARLTHDGVRGVEVLGPARPMEIQVIAAPGRINGQNAMLVDVDSNGTIDVAVTGDGRGEPHFYDISGENLVHGGGHAPGGQSDDYLAANDLPDYTNDGNIDNLA